jgi:hypothetical protein
MMDSTWLASVSAERSMTVAISSWVFAAAGGLAAALVGAGAKGLIDSVQWNRTERHGAYLGLVNSADALVRAYARAWARRDLKRPLNTDALDAALDACRDFDMAVTRVRLVGRGLLLDVADEMSAISFESYWDGVLADSPYRDRERDEGEEPDAYTLAEDDFLTLYTDFCRARPR